MKKIIASCTIVIVLFQAKSQVVEEVSTLVPIFQLGSAQLNDKLIYYGASIEQSGLVVSDGTDLGTEVLSIPGFQLLQARDFTIFNDKVYFAAYDDGGGNELWVTDGTAQGTYIVKDINSNGSSYPGSFVVMNNFLYFNADDGIHGTELWRTDGSELGTVLVKDINSGGFSSDIYELKVFNNAIYFSARGTIDGEELWISDGTSNGTMLFKDINETGDSGPFGFFEHQGKLYFSATNGIEGRELYVTDGTVQGTEIVQDINVGSSGSNPDNLFSAGNYLFFSASTASTGIELFWYNSQTGANGMHDFNATSFSSMAIPVSFINDRLMVSAFNQNGDFRMHSFNLSTGIIDELLPLNLEFSDDMVYMMPQMMSNKLYFCGDDGTRGRELWLTDGSSAGTYKVAPAIDNVGDPLKYAENLVSFDNSLYFIGVYSSNGRVLCKVFDPSASIDELNEEKIIVYPNPATTQITIDSPSSQKIEIYDVIGNLVTTQFVQGGETTIDVSNFESGCYFVQGQYHQNAVKIFINK